MQHHPYIDPNGGKGRPYGLPLQAGEVAIYPVRRRNGAALFFFGLAAGLFFVIGAEVALILKGVIG